MKRIPIIMDVDTGIDDAFALMLAGASPALELLAVTTVFGNRPLEDTTENTLKICELLGLKVPVAAGAEKAVVVPKADYENFSGPRVHGEDGLGDQGARLPKPVKTVEPVGAVSLMADILNQHPEPVTLVPVGPMTNIATLILAHPELHSKIARVVLMGGAVFGGNAMPTAEANIYHDPEAAQILFASGIDIVMCGLDATMQVYATHEDRARFSSVGNAVSDFLVSMMPCYAKHYEDVAGHPGCVLHDSVPVAYLNNPHCVQLEDYSIEVDLTGRYTRGCTVTDTRLLSAKRPNVRVAMNADRDDIIEQHLKALARYST